MAKSVDASHVKNVANMDELISSILSYGIKYNPSNPLLKLESMQSLYSLGEGAISDVNSTHPASTLAVSIRDNAFKPLSKLTTRVINSLKATQVPVQIIENVRTIVRKIQGVRATPKKSDEEKKALEAEGKVVKEISSSQMGFDDRLDNFDKLIKLLSGIPLYDPNEEDLKISTLTILYNDLKDKNTAAIVASTPLTNARIARQITLYKEGTGLVDTCLSSKNYINSVFGADSPQYKKIAKLAFRNIRY